MIIRIFLFYLIIFAYINLSNFYLNLHQLSYTYPTEIHTKDEISLSYSKSVIKPKWWITVSAVNYRQVQAIMISEDWSFPYHLGVDWKQIVEGVTDYLTGNKSRLRGASTITQQLAKNLFLNQKKSWWRKFKELFVAVNMELILGKKRILELYLNTVHLGEGIYGVSEASWHYFARDFQDLSLKEAAFLAMLLPNPRKNAQSFRVKELTPYASNVITSILNKLRFIKLIGASEYSAELGKEILWNVN